MYLPTLPKTWRIVRVRERSRCSVMNLYEALEGLRCPGARLCRCLNRNSGLLRSYAVRRCEWDGSRGLPREKVRKRTVPGVESTDRRDIKGSQVAWPDEDDDKTVCNKIVRRVNCPGCLDYKIGRALRCIFALTSEN